MARTGLRLGLAIADDRFSSVLGSMIEASYLLV